MKNVLLLWMQNVLKLMHLQKNKLKFKGKQLKNVF